MTQLTLLDRVIKTALELQAVLVKKPAKVNLNEQLAQLEMKNLNSTYLVRAIRLVPDNVYRTRRKEMK